MTNFIDWNDQNAHAAAESAVRLMRDGCDYEYAIHEAARLYSAPKASVERLFKRIAGVRR
jgi:hypothetical protein